MAEHTPTPWAINYNPGQKGQPATWIMQERAEIHEKVIAECQWGEDGDTDGPDGDGVCDCTAAEAQANAVFIVRACNSHAALVAALTRAGKALAADTSQSSLAQDIRDALKLAGEP